MPSGRRFGDQTGDQFGECVGDLPTDAGVTSDTPTAGQACFGTSLLRICLVTTPVNALPIPVLTVIDTDTSPMCAAVKSGGNYCVLAGTTITIDAKLRAAGMRPLVLLATDSITIGANGVVDVGSHNGATPEVGAGGDPAGCVAPMAAGTSGGGAGGSFLGTGGNGGTGGMGAGAGGGGGGGAAAAITTVTALRGGCAGQDGEENGNAAAKGLQGHGGGAVYLIAGNKIDVQGAVNAAGEGGGPGVTGSAGGGGGGAGGMIGFDAPMITASGLILASGGGGGEGSGPATLGIAGADPTTTAAADGGKTGTANSGGDGGNGSTATAAAPGATGNPGNSTNGGGGGGGGGGAGLIKAPATATLGAQISPAATP